MYLEEEEIITERILDYRNLHRLVFPWILTSQVDRVKNEFEESRKGYG